MDLFLIPVMLILPFILTFIECRYFIHEMVSFRQKYEKRNNSDGCNDPNCNEAPKGVMDRLYRGRTSKKKGHLKTGECIIDYRENGWIIDSITILLSILFEKVFLEEVLKVQFNAHWTEQLYNKQLHQPINLAYIWGPISILVLYLIGLIILYKCNPKKTPPLVIALAMGAIYLGSIYFFIWFFHSLKADILSYYLVLQPLNIFFISTRIILQTVQEYEPDPNRMSKINGNRFLSFLNNWSQKTSFLPVAGLVFMIPLFGISMLILLLFGQAPDSAIKAFTETSDFLLSTKVSPQNLYFDEHYLCTVAAGGDRKIVKPLRKGVRHGHPVIVNRQLQVANAFEEIIMVKTPKAHRRIRHFYDTYGFPVAKAIKKNWIADMVYFMMKPLEWIFIVVLYCTEVHPEDRIALQYTGTTLERWKQ